MLFNKFLNATLALNATTFFTQWKVDPVKTCSELKAATAAIDRYFDIVTIRDNVEKNEATRRNNDAEKQAAIFADDNRLADYRKKEPLLFMLNTVRYWICIANLTNNIIHHEQVSTKKNILHQQTVDVVSHLCPSDAPDVLANLPEPAVTAAFANISRIHAAELMLDDGRSCIMGNVNTLTETCEQCAAILLSSASAKCPSLASIQQCSLPELDPGLKSWLSSPVGWIQQYL